MFQPTAPPMVAEPTPGTTVFVNATDNVTVSCTASGLPAPDIRFLNGRGVLSTSGRIDVGTLSDPTELASGASLVSRTLTISATVDGDSGQYSCEAFNTIPGLDLNLNDSRDFELVVQSKHIHCTLAA